MVHEGSSSAGSLPNGVPPTILTRLARLAADRGVPYAVDTSGAPLAAAVAAGGLAVVKPNDEELAELVGRRAVDRGRRARGGPGGPRAGQ